jgi:hypothetical protein
MSVATAFGCGDGIGRPIVEEESSASAAGAPGTAGSIGAAGAATGGAAGASAASAGAGSGAYGGLPAFGGHGSDGPEGEGRGERRPDLRCDGIDEWSEDSARREGFLFDLLNAAREYGVACGSGTGTGAAVPRVTMRSELQCAARLHARDMYENAFFGHIGSDGLGPDERMRRAGYSDFGVAGETIVESAWAGEEMVPYRTLDPVFEMGGSECAHLVDPRFDSVGIGFFGDLWTLDFAGP